VWRDRLFCIKCSIEERREYYVHKYENSFCEYDGNRGNYHSFKCCVNVSQPCEESTKAFSSDNFTGSASVPSVYIFIYFIFLFLTPFPCLSLG
jgi:hypothetical protein